MKKVIKSSQSVLALVMAVGLAGLAGCETNPYTGRSQLLMTSVDQEMQMGAQAYARSKTIRKCTSHRILEKLSRSGVWLLA